MTNTKLLGFVAIAFLAGTITSGTVAFADKDPKSPFDVIVTAINNLTTAINNKQTTVTVNAPAGPPGPAGPQGPTGATGPQGPAGSGTSTVSFYTVSASTSVPPGLARDADAYCNTGDFATGGGFTTDITGLEQVDVRPLSGGPGLPPDGWGAEALNTNSIAVNENAVAVCEKTH